MNGYRIASIMLMLIGLACSALGCIMGITPFLMDVRLPDGTIAQTGTGFLVGLMFQIPAGLLVVLALLLWWVFRPKQHTSAVMSARIDQLCEIALRSYLDWIGALQRSHIHEALGANNSTAQLIRTRTLALLTVLDPFRKRVVLQFLYDLRLISGPHALDLSGADIRDADLSGIDLRGANLSGVDLRGASLDQAALGGANLSNALLDREQFTQLLPLAPLTQGGPVSNRPSNGEHHAYP
jgi:hypothetical protein